MVTQTVLDLTTHITLLENMPTVVEFVYFPLI